MCLVRSWKIGFWAIYREDWLSQNKDIGVDKETPRLWSKARSYLSLAVMLAIERNSTSADERDTVYCFLVFQEIGEEPRNTIQPESECCVNGQLAQSESHQPVKVKLTEELRRIPCPNVPLRQQTIRRAASQCSWWGECMNWDNMCTYKLDRGEWSTSKSDNQRRVYTGQAQTKGHYWQRLCRDSA